jgi:hypothetical protein
MGSFLLPPEAAATATYFLPQNRKTLTQDRIPRGTFFEEEDEEDEGERRSELQPRHFRLRTKMDLPRFSANAAIIGPDRIGSGEAWRQ